HFKFEGLNPTGSFKDRGMVVAVARAMEAGSEAIVCASTGNTSASAAAYAARFGLRAIVVVPSGKIAPGKLLQAQIHGAKVLAIKGNFDRALQTVRDLCERYPVTLVNSVNPFRIEGQKTAAFEIVDELGDAPEVLAIPVGDAGSDGEILNAQRWLASAEGIFAEPASAASLAVLAKSVRSGLVAPGTHAVCVLTGSGLKDPDAARKDLSPPVVVDEDAENIAR